MEFNDFLNSAAIGRLTSQSSEKSHYGGVDLSRAASLKVEKELYNEAEARGMSLSELLECDEYDPSPQACPLDAFERQLALAGIRLSGRTPTTVEQFFQNAPTLLPEFMLREIRRGQSMRPELSKLIANTTNIASNSYTPFFIDTGDSSKFSLRPVAEGADVPQMLVTEQNHAVNVSDYGLALKASYKALRYRTTSQFRVLLWYIGFQLQTDKMAMVVDTIINGDGNSNAATTINTAVSATLDYDDIITLWAQFSPFEMNTIVCHINQLKTILTLAEFKDPLAGNRFQKTGELLTPLGSTLIRSDDVASDLVIGLDSRFAIEEVITQPLIVEYDKVIEQRFEEAVITESVAYAKVIKEASVVMDTVWT
ncbi:MAG: hypothetical protein IID63_03680 [candidate division Zixibacteria bacterium]|nr:hypothetical protein [candidate division Zixibacteria bacterium]